MKKLQYSTNDPAASTDYLAGDNTWKTIPGGGGGAKSFLATLQGSTVPASSTRYGCVIYSTVTTIENARAFIIPYNCTISNLYIRIFTAQSATGSLTFTMRKNYVDTPIVTIIAAGSAAGTEANSGALSDTYLAGDDCTFKVVNAATTTSANIHNSSIMLEI